MSLRVKRLRPHSILRGTSHGQIRTALSQVPRQSALSVIVTCARCRPSPHPRDSAELRSTASSRTTVARASFASVPGRRDSRRSATTCASMQRHARFKLVTIFVVIADSAFFGAASAGEESGRFLLQAEKNSVLLPLFSCFYACARRPLCSVEYFNPLTRTAAASLPCMSAW